MGRQVGFVVGTKRPPNPPLPLSPHLSPLLGRLQFLLDLLQGRVAALGHGAIELWHPVKGRGLEDDLEGLARRPLVQLNYLHVFDDAPAQVHRICGVGKWKCLQPYNNYISQNNICWLLKRVIVTFCLVCGFVCRLWVEAGTEQRHQGELLDLLFVG